MAEAKQIVDGILDGKPSPRLLRAALEAINSNPTQLRQKVLEACGIEIGKTTIVRLVSDNALEVYSHGGNKNFDEDASKRVIQTVADIILPKLAGKSHENLAELKAKFIEFYEKKLQAKIDESKLHVKNGPRVQKVVGKKEVYTRAHSSRTAEKQEMQR